jgi:putative transposase
LSYQGRKAAKGAPVVERMKELSAQYPRYGYRRIRILLERDGHRMSPGRAHRLWRAAGLQVPRKQPRKRVAAARPRGQPSRALPQYPRSWISGSWAVYA